MNAPTENELPTRLILASSSAYRRELLERLCIPFDVISPVIDESRHAGETPENLVQRLALEKASAVANRIQNPAQRLLIIGSDQLGVHKGEMLGKPGTSDGAIAQLTQLAGGKIKFLTALCLLDTRSGNVFSALDITLVHFRALTTAEISRYVALEQPLDCAGSFKSEGLGVSLFNAIESSDPTALIGLPLIALCQGLRAADYDPLRSTE